MGDHMLNKSGTCRVSGFDHQPSTGSSRQVGCLGDSPAQRFSSEARFIAEASEEKKRHGAWFGGLGGGGCGEAKLGGHKESDQITPNTRRRTDKLITHFGGQNIIWVQEISKDKS